MRHTPLSLILSAAALLGCSLASAQTLTIDGINTTLQNLSGQASVTIDPVTGNVVVKSASGSACSTTVLQPTASVTGPSSGQTQQQVTVNWTSTNTSGSVCTPTSNPFNSTWNNPSPAGVSGSRLVTLPTVTSGSVNQALTMTCTGGAGTTPAVSTLNITVNAIPPLTGCEGTPSDGLSVQLGSWTDLHPGSAFPLPFGNTKSISVSANESAAVAFTTGSASVNPSVQFQTTEASGLPGGPVRISISRCAGDFREELYTGKRCATRGDGNQQTLNYVINGQQQTFNCILAPQTQYYFNLTFKVLPFAGVTPGDCNAGACTSLFLTRANTRMTEEGDGEDGGDGGDDVDGSD